jgi:hypothetical protein
MSTPYDEILCPSGTYVARQADLKELVEGKIRVS